MQQWPPAASGSQRWPPVNFPVRDYLLSSTWEKKTAVDFWEWLQKFNPVPDDLIQLWAEYTFMGLCNETWTGIELTEEPSDSCHDILSQASPELIAILDAYKVLLSNGMPHTDSFLFRIRSSLGLSWATLRAAIRPLHRILGMGSEREQLGNLLLAFSSDQTLLRRVDSNFVVLELARGSLRLMKGGVSTAENSWLSYVAGGWGFCLRSCPPSPDLLQNVNAFEIELTGLLNPWIPHAEEIHQVVEWLENHLKVSIEQDSNLPRRFLKAIFVSNSSQTMWVTTLDIPFTSCKINTSHTGDRTVHLSWVTTFKGKSIIPGTYLDSAMPAFPIPHSQS
ncbi:hypothetical protein C8J57DRAFT_1247826 [Mycena rebaudengoi]|nr:hypothetical protein C8J57DRAFT_1247826 [Mycena rebaudengoi]